MLTNETLDRLLVLSRNQLTEQAVKLLQLPDGTELDKLQYLATRLQPVMLTYCFDSVEQALEAITSHYEYYSWSVRAKCSARSDKAVRSLMLNSSEGTSAYSINPWTYGVAE